MVERTADPARVMLVEDNPSVGRAVAAVLDASADLHVCGMATSVAEAAAVAEACRPDVVVIDLRLPDGSGVEVGRAVRSWHPEVRVMLLTSASEDEALMASVLAGASGYLVKQVLGTDLVGAVRAVAAGSDLIDPALRKAAVGRIDAGSLDQQGSEVLSLVAAGLTDRQIADELEVGEATVQAQVRCLVERPSRRPLGGRNARSRHFAAHLPTSSRD